jgi:SynChlorMet cassette protein ScmC
MAVMYSFQLDSGISWHLAAGDPVAEPVVDGLAAVMCLTGEAAEEGRGNNPRMVRVFAAQPDHPPDGVTCILPRPKTPGETVFDQYTAIAHALARGLLQDGGILLHGALAEYRPQDTPGKGVVFSAPGGAGKSTTSRRLPVPWRSLSDDAVLVVPAGTGGYRAHPWPTWSTFLYDDRTGGVWDVGYSVPLRACVFLKRAGRDALEPLGAGHAASLLNESARQINFRDAHLPPGERRKLRLRRFDAVCRLAKAVPAHLLHISLEGEFWRELESILR